MSALYKIAGRKIEIRSLHDAVHRLCRDYRCDGVPDFTVEIRQEDINAERTHADTADYTDSYLETLAVYRKIADWMLDCDTILFHGSCVAVDDAGYLFTAKSGTGKSTHSRLWREYLGERAVMINDDKPLLRITDTGVIAYGTPWNGKHGLGENIAVPLQAICILTRDTKNHIEPIDRRTAYPMLLQQTHRPQNPAEMSKMLALVDRLADNVRLYRLGCNMDIEAAKIAYEGMVKK